MNASEYIFAVDPGTTESAFVLLRGDKIVRAGIHPNEEIMRQIYDIPDHVDAHFVIEMIAPYGRIGKTTIETIFWIGIFWEQAFRAERYDMPIFSYRTRLFRREVLKTILGKGSVKGGDSKIRAAMIERYGAPGTKKNPGPTYGITADEWSALAVATAYKDRMNKGAQ